MAARQRYLRLIVATLAVLALTILVSSVVPSGYAQTVPTITPTPPPGQGPSPTPGGGDPPPTSQPPPATPPPPSPTVAAVATSTRPPGGLPTATRRATAGSSPTALFSGTAASLPTAEPCGLEPTMRISGGGAWIYEGPGEDYERVGRLASGTVRPVIGRAASAAWWVIVLDADESAWIADDDGTIQGDTREVAIVSAPPLPGDTTPTPAPTWAPTPNPQCVEPTPDATATTTATVTNTPTASPSASPTAAPTEEATATPQVEAAPLPDDDDGDNLFWLPVAGFVLLAAGAFLYVTRRS